MLPVDLVLPVNYFTLYASAAKNVEQVFEPGLGLEPEPGLVMTPWDDPSKKLISLHRKPGRCLGLLLSFTLFSFAWATEVWDLNVYF
jgi:hypothetical protein